MQFKGCLLLDIPTIQTASTRAINAIAQNVLKYLNHFRIAVTSELMKKEIILNK